MMENLISSWSENNTLPENYVFPQGNRPGQLVFPNLETIPIIDLGQVDRSQLVSHIFEATKHFGFFQVINHGIPRELMDNARSVLKEFFELPSQEKARFWSEDPTQSCILYTSNVGYDKEQVHCWRDALRLSCVPLEECIQHWPQNPTKFREVVGDYVIEVSKLGDRILELICEGLELKPGYFAKELNKEPVMVVNHYPPCPDPSLTLGCKEHIDPNLITLVLQGNVPGLQVLKDGQWVGVEPIPDAFVVNLGHILEIVSNGKLKGVEHRVVTNAKESRTTAAFFIEPRRDCFIEPAKAMVSQGNPPIFKPIQYREILKAFKAVFIAEVESLSQHWKLL